MPAKKLPLDVLVARGALRRNPGRHLDLPICETDDGYLVSDAVVPAFLTSAAVMIAAGCEFAKADNLERYQRQIEVAKTGQALRLSITYHGPTVVVRYEIVGRKDEIYEFNLPRAG